MSPQKASRSQRVAWIDLERAQLRVGTVPRKRLEWAIAFAATNLEDRTAAELVDLRLQLTAFRWALIWWSRIPNPWRDRLMPKFGHHQLAGDIGLEDSTGTGHSPVFFNVDELRKTQERFQAVLAALQVGSYDLTLRAKVDISIRPRQKLDRGIKDFDNVPFYGSGLFSPLIRIEDKMEGALFRLAELLDVFGELVHRCPEERGGCGRVFLASRTDRVFCSQQCLSRSTTKAWRAKQPKRGAK